LVLCGVLIDEKTEKEFKKLGVKDSKQLTPKRREFLAEIIREKSEAFELVIIHPEEIDEKNKEGINLNDVEAFACAKIINKINKGFDKMRVVIDCPSTNPTKWREFLRKEIDDLSNLDLSCEHKADQKHISVSAASILAMRLWLEFTSLANWTWPMWRLRRSFRRFSASLSFNSI